MNIHPVTYGLVGALSGALITHVIHSNSDAAYEKEVAEAKQQVVNKISRNRPKSFEWLSGPRIKSERTFARLDLKNFTTIDLVGFVGGGENRLSPSVEYQIDYTLSEDWKDGAFYVSPVSAQFTDDRELIVTDRNRYAVKTSRGETVLFPYTVETKMLPSGNTEYWTSEYWSSACNSLHQLNDSGDCVPYITVDKIVVEPAEERK